TWRNISEVEVLAYLASSLPAYVKSVFDSPQGRFIGTHHLTDYDMDIQIVSMDYKDDPNLRPFHHYHIVYGSGTQKSPLRHIYIPFQDGPPGDVGVNGLTIESLLAICIDRLQGFQSG